MNIIYSDVVSRVRVRMRNNTANIICLHRVPYQNIAQLENPEKNNTGKKNNNNKLKKKPLYVNPASRNSCENSSNFVEQFEIFFFLHFNINHKSNNDKMTF